MPWKANTTNADAHLEELRLQREAAVHRHWTPDVGEYEGHKAQCPCCEHWRRLEVVQTIYNTLSLYTETNHNA